ncbi:hypothetical protein B0H63DRAFT_544128 [Podospora didyma]|uniref:NAD dependent epimerase/dehydratase n=1 Tax=Podospora didyma TaxID=330526 RepID=A0AAE0NQA2_9PEZI|nr:hypothetical protein B0H63DRAFT_544128 [Podospora didyma]
MSPPPSSTGALKPNRPMQVLSLGCAKTGTASMAAAYRTLGYQDVHHGLDAVVDSPSDFTVLSRAADATFPYLKTYTGKPFAREEWDEIFGPCEAVTDLASFFGPALVAAYPEAKVVLVERPVNAWLKSFDVSLVMCFGPLAQFFIKIVEPLIGSPAGPASLKFQSGWLEADDLANARARAPGVYRRHYETLRRIVPRERLLEYRLGDGWAPLCEFLGKEVPDVEFPRVNEAEEFKKLPVKMMWKHWEAAKRIYGRWVVGAAVVGLGVLVARRNGVL